MFIIKKEIEITINILKKYLEKWLRLVASK
jgi:hypothetical protein